MDLIIGGTLSSSAGEQDGEKIFLNLPEQNMISEDKVKLWCGEKLEVTVDLFSLIVHIISHETVHMVLEKNFDNFISVLLDYINFEKIEEELYGISYDVF